MVVSQSASVTPPPCPLDAPPLPAPLLELAGSALQAPARTKASVASVASVARRVVKERCMAKIEVEGRAA